MTPNIRALSGKLRNNRYTLMIDLMTMHMPIILSMLQGTSIPLSSTPAPTTLQPLPTSACLLPQWKTATRWSGALRPWEGCGSGNIREKRSNSLMGLWKCSREWALTSTRKFFWARRCYRLTLCCIWGKTSSRRTTRTERGEHFIYQ